MKLKTTFAALAIVATATAATAGSMTEPVVETQPDMFVPATGSFGSLGAAGAVAAGLVAIGVIVAASDGT